MQVQTRLSCALIAVVLAAACGGGGSSASTTPTSPTPPPGSGTPATPGTNEVIATNENTFNPTSLTVPRGTTVTFTFQTATHNVNFGSTAGAPANIPNTSSSAVARVFSTAGTFVYDCTLHAGMRGTVVAN